MKSVPWGRDQGLFVLWPASLPPKAKYLIQGSGAECGDEASIASFSLIDSLPGGSEHSGQIDAPVTTGSLGSLPL